MAKVDPTWYGHVYLSPEQLATRAPHVGLMIGRNVKMKVTTKDGHRSANLSLVLSQGVEVPIRVAENLLQGEQELLSAIGTTVLALVRSNEWRGKVTYYLEGILNATDILSKASASRTLLEKYLVGGTLHGFEIERFPKDAAAKLGDGSTSRSKVGILVAISEVVAKTKNEYYRLVIGGGAQFLSALAWMDTVQDAYAAFDMEGQKLDVGCIVKYKIDKKGDLITISHIEPVVDNDE